MKWQMAGSDPAAPGPLSDPAREGSTVVAYDSTLDVRVSIHAASAARIIA